MELIKARGIVIKETDFSDNDKYITVFAKGLGKISVYARGARKVKSKYLAASTVFCYADFVLMEGKKSYTLRSAEIIDSFFGLREDLLALSYASFYLELLDKNIPQSAPEDDILLLLLKSLKRLCINKAPMWLTDMVFEYKLLEYNGYAPELECCRHCGGENISHIDEYGLICADCANSAEEKISPAVVSALRYIAASDLDNAFSFVLADKYKSEVQQILHRLIMHSFNHQYKSYNFLTEIY